MSAPLLSRRQRRWLPAALALWFFICLAWLAPAALFAALLRQALPPLQLGAVEGSFWQGRAAQAHWSWRGRSFALGRVEWRLRPWSLLLLQPRARLHATFDRQFFDGELMLSPFGGVTLRDARAALPVPALRQWLPLPADGLLTAQLARAAFTADGALRAVSGEVQWQRAAWQWERRWLPLGDYRCVLGADKGGNLTGELSGGDGVALSGRLWIDPDIRHWSLEGVLTPAATLPPALSEGIGLLLGGERRGDGAWVLRRQGQR